MKPEINPEDYVISDQPGGYYVSQIDQLFSDFDAAIDAIRQDMAKSEFFPDVWFVNDHGNIDLLAIDQSTVLPDERHVNSYRILKQWV